MLTLKPAMFVETSAAINRQRETKFFLDSIMSIAVETKVRTVTFEKSCSRPPQGAASNKEILAA